MRALVIGLGTQGYKRVKSLIKKNFFVCSVDPYNKKADFKHIKHVSNNIYDTVFICTPDNFKEKYINFFLKKKKNVFVEKPLLISKKKNF